MSQFSNTFIPQAFRQTMTPYAGDTLDIGDATYYLRSVYARNFITAGSGFSATLSSDASLGPYLRTTTNHDLVMGANSLPMWTLTTAGALHQHGTNGGNLVMQRVGQGTYAFILGDTSIVAGISGSFGVPAFFMKGNNNGADEMICVGSGNNAVGHHLFLGKTRSTGSDALAAAAVSDEIFTIASIVADGTSWRRGGGVSMKVIAMTGANNWDTQLDLSARAGSTTTIGFSIMNNGTPKFYLTTSAGAGAGLINNCPAATLTPVWVDVNVNGTPSVFATYPK